MTFKFVKSAEKKRIIEELNVRFGITNFPHLLIESGKEKMRAYSGSLSRDEIVELGRIAKVEGIGLYLLKREVGGFRLSFEGTQMLKSQITKNVIDLDDEQLALWIRGNDLEIESPKGVLIVQNADSEEIEGMYIIKHGSDYLGCGKSNTKKLYNHVPKERRLKK